MERESGKKRRAEGGSGGEEQMVSVGSNCGTIDLEALDCTVCNDPLRAPIFQCAAGHVICLSCHRKLRNKNMHGWNYLEGADHELCPCASCFCPQSNCYFNGSTADLLEHLIDDVNWPSTEFEYGLHFDLQIKKGMHVLHTKEDGPLFLVKFTPVPPFGNAVSIVCVHPHATLGVREFRCVVSSNCNTASWRSAFRTRSTNLFDGLQPEDGSYSLVVPTISSGSGINVTISKVSE